MLEQLSKIGSECNEQHCHTNLLQLLAQCGVPDLITMAREYPCILSSTYTALLHKHGERRFRICFGACLSESSTCMLEIIPCTTSGQSISNVS